MPSELGFSVQRTYNASAGLLRRAGYLVAPPGGVERIEWWGRWFHTDTNTGRGFVEWMPSPDSMRDHPEMYPHDFAYYQRETARPVGAGGSSLEHSRAELLWRVIVEWPPGELPDRAKYIGPWTIWDGKEQP